MVSSEKSKCIRSKLKIPSSFNLFQKLMHLDKLFLMYFYNVVNRFVCRLSYEEAVRLVKQEMEQVHLYFSVPPSNYRVFPENGSPMYQKKKKQKKCTVG